MVNIFFLLKENSLLLYVTGGRAVEVFGQRFMGGFGITMGAVMVFVSPWAADVSPYLFFVSRLALGIFHGPTLPCCISLLSKWAPRSQLSTMMTIINGGNGSKQRF